MKPANVLSLTSALRRRSHRPTHPSRGDIESAPVISATASSWAKHSTEHKVDIGPTPSRMGSRNWSRDVRRRDHRSSTSAAIHGISGIPIARRVSLGGVRIVMGPKRGPKAFPSHIWPDTPSLRELVASTAPPGSQDPRSKPNLRPGLRRWYRMAGAHPGADLSLGMPHRVVPILIFAGAVATSIRLLLSLWLGWFRWTWWKSSVSPSFLPEEMNRHRIPLSGTKEPWVAPFALDRHRCR